MAGERAVAHRRQLPHDGRLMVEVDGRTIGIFDIGGELYAVLNQCADEGGPVCLGALVENVKASFTPDGRVREYVEDRGFILACPWHGWEYDIRTGDCLWNRRFHLRTYRVREDEQGNILVAI